MCSSQQDNLFFWLYTVIPSDIFGSFTLFSLISFSTNIFFKDIYRALFLHSAHHFLKINLLIKQQFYISGEEIT